MVLVISFLRLDGGAPATVAPSPSAGKWASEEYFGPVNERPNEPSIFMQQASNDKSTAPAAKGPYRDDESPD